MKELTQEERNIVGQVTARLIEHFAEIDSDDHVMVVLYGDRKEFKKDEESVGGVSTDRLQVLTSLDDPRAQAFVLKLWSEKLKDLFERIEEARDRLDLDDTKVVQ